MVRYLEELFVQDERLNRIRGVVLDLDDTLINQKRWILDKLRGVHAKFRRKLPALGIFLPKAVRILEEGNRSTLVDALCESFCLGPELRDQLVEAYRAFCPTNGHVFVDVPPVLSELKRRGYKLAILTNNPPKSQRQKIVASGLEDFFDAIVYARELGAEKPDKRSFRHVAGRLKLPPNTLVMVGDHLYTDIVAALQSGYRHGFFLTRPGGFLNFDLGVFEEVSGSERRFTVIPSLRDTLRYLRPIE
jgi:HAD superfamily hydrolase (TIGR01509 family)